MTIDAITVDTADVYKAGVLAGRLRRDLSSVTYEYVANYLDNSNVPRVAWTIPRSAGPVVATGGSVPPFFAGLLPEGARLQAVVTATRTSIDDHFTLLVAVGNDAIGDVRIVPEGVDPTDPPVVLTESTAAGSDLEAVFNEASGADTLLYDPAALPGAQPKVSAAMWSAPLRTDAGPAILKLNFTDRFRKLVENEHFFLRVAAGCGLRVPRHRLIRDRYGRTGLLVERFDRKSTPDGTRSYAQEDACQVMGVYPAAKYRLKTEDAVAALSDACERSGGSARVARLEFLRLVAFSYLIGNGDLHGKNLSIGADANGRWSPTPAYDLVCTQPYFSWRDPMALDLYGRANKLFGQRLIEAGEHWQIPERAVRRMLGALTEGIEPWLDRVGEIGFDTKVTAELARTLARRRDELARD